MKKKKDEIAIGVSACLLGQKVRYDGGHKKNDFVKDVFGPFVRYVSVCPEFEIGMGIPREPIHLEKTADGVRLVSINTGKDYTEKMKRYTENRAKTLQTRDSICGFIFKKDSPSCGMERVRIYEGSAPPVRSGEGIFAEGMKRRNPLLPVEEEGRLNDPALRENFIESVFAYKRLTDLFGGSWRARDLVDFHTREKYLLLVHDPKVYASLGQLVARVKSVSRSDMAERYSAEFMGAIRKVASPARHVNVLQHMMGYFRKQLNPDDKAELMTVLQDYRKGFVPLVVPVTLIRHYVRQFQVVYLQGQTYLSPHPKELMLRNHV